MLTDQASLGTAPAAPSLPWYQVWLKAITEPKEATYQDLVTRPGVSLGKACLWVGVVGVISAIISLGFFVVFGGMSFLGPWSQETSDALSFLTGSAIFLVCLVPLAGAFAVFGLLFSSGISHLLARALGGTGSYEQLAYAIAAYTAPGSLVSSAVSFIPCVGPLVGLPFSFYLLFLNVLAIKAVHHLSWGRAVISSVLFVAFVLFILSCVVIVILALLGPAIGNVFSGIVEEI